MITDEEIRKLVVARLRSFPSGKKISIGSNGEFSRDELINNVQEGSEIGNKIITIQLNYLRVLKTGTLTDD